jgi:hypothetical protein
MTDMGGGSIEMQTMLTDYAMAIPKTNYIFSPAQLFLQSRLELLFTYDKMLDEDRYRRPEYYHR